MTVSDGNYVIVAVHTVKSLFGVTFVDGIALVTNTAGDRETDILNCIKFGMEVMEVGAGTVLGNYFINGEQKA